MGCQRNLKALNLSAACSGSGLLTPQYYRIMNFLSGKSATGSDAFTVVQTQVGAGGLGGSG